MPRSRTGARLGEKKAQARLDTDFLAGAWADFAGYVAADARYDGPCGVLSAVDKRCDQRLRYAVWEHDPTHEDSRAFLERFKTAVVARGLPLCGGTPDGAALYPAPLREVVGQVRHHICQLHGLKDIVKAVVGAGASARQGLAAQQPTLRKGRPSTPAAQPAARPKKRGAAQRVALFTQR